MIESYVKSKKKKKYFRDDRRYDFKKREKVTFLHLKKSNFTFSTTAISFMRSGENDSNHAVELLQIENIRGKNRKEKN